MSIKSNFSSDSGVIPSTPLSKKVGLDNSDRHKLFTKIQKEAIARIKQEKRDQLTLRLALLYAKLCRRLYAGAVGDRKRFQSTEISGLGT